MVFSSFGQRFVFGFADFTYESVITSAISYGSLYYLIASPRNKLLAVWELDTEGELLHCLILKSMYLKFKVALMESVVVVFYNP